jgi:molybdopterin synthase sulfur carrier subunit
MKIRAYATLREVFGWGQLDLTADGASTVGAVLRHLVEQHPALGAMLWDADGRLTGFVTVLVNGRSIEYLAGLDTPLDREDTVALIPPVSGG